MDQGNKVPGKSKELIPGFVTMDDFTKQGFSILMEAIRNSNALPSDQDWNFYNTFEAFPKIMSQEGDTIHKCMNRLLRYNEIDGNMKNRTQDEQTELVVEANDMILEKVENNVDDLLGLRTTHAEPILLQTVSAQLPINGSWNRNQQTTFSVSNTLQPSSADSSSCVKLITAKNIVRPQMFFKDKIDNSNTYPWEPRIKDKPNSLKPLAIFLEECEDGRNEYSHPYQLELDRFTPPEEQLQMEHPELPKPTNETPLIEVDTPEKLDDLLESLRKCKEFAVDVEHHSYRSFMGFSCLLQISTADTDYLIDTLTLRDKLHILNEVFTKNTIVKIFHGADSDIQWLQRDLSIYVVNMFDTHQASLILEYGATSLAYLLKMFCNHYVDKQFQLADWRIRPLPEELKRYAREDTHFLIYVYKRLKNELLKRGPNLLNLCFERSTEICKKRYFKPLLTDESYLNIYRRSKKMFDNRQLFALQEIFAWRDKVAREEDESTGYVLPNHMLLQISEKLPREMQGILACCNPIPPLVKSHLLDIHQIVLKAREQPLEKAILKDNTSGRGVLKTVSLINIDSPLHCPHDISKSTEFRDNLPVLLSNVTEDLRGLLKTSTKLEKKTPSYTVFNVDAAVSRKITKRREKPQSFKYLSPYQRYILVRPVIQAEEDQKLEKQKEKKAEEDKALEKADSQEARTDEDRIESIRQHFLQMSQKFSDDLAAKQKKEAEEAAAKEKAHLRAQSLLQMGGTLKRKREKSSSDEETDCKSMRMIDTKALQSSVPNKTIKREAQSGLEVFVSGENQKGKKNREKKKWRYSKQGDKLEGGQKTPAEQVRNQTPKRPRTKKKNKNQKKQDKNFVPYDYTSVDFRQFRGGAREAQTGAKIQKSNFKSKGQMKRFRGTKAATFAGSNNRGRRGGKGARSSN